MKTYKNKFFPVIYIWLGCSKRT